MPRMTHARPLRRLALAAALSALAAPIALVPLDADKPLADRVVIRRDTFGVPHIVAETEAAADELIGPIERTIRQRLGNTLILMGASFSITLIISLFLGMYSATHQYSAGGYVVTAFSFFGYSMPSFWFGLMLIILFAVKFREWGLPYLPAAGMYPIREEPSFLQMVRHLVLPATVLSLISVAKYTRYLRSSMLETISQDYVRTARAKGLGESAIMFRHILKGGLLPVVGYLGPAFACIITGSIVVEQIFRVPGLGQFFILSAINRDYTLIMGTVIVDSVILLVMNFLVDILYGFMDPRITYK